MKETAETLFGPEAATWLPVLDTIVPSLTGYRYTFMPGPQFLQLLEKDVARGMQVYWQEILCRCHLAAAASLMRFTRWIEGVQNAGEAGNALAYAACMRGAIESAADTFEALHDTPYNLADAHTVIRKAVTAKLQTPTLHQHLEDKLIHFTHGRRLEKGENAPVNHKAKTVAEYLRSFAATEQPAIQACYSELCQVTHPATSSLIPFLAASEDGTEYSLHYGNQEEAIVAFAEDHRSSMLPLFTFCIVPAIVTLRILNRLPMATMRTGSVERVDLSESDTWAKASERLRSPQPPRNTELVYNKSVDDGLKA